jgi:hypothetical protein
MGIGLLISILTLRMTEKEAGNSSRMLKKSPAAFSLGFEAQRTA